MAIGFLFLTISDLHPVWETWFPHIDNIYIHNKSKFHKNKFVTRCIPSIKTEWGKISIVNAMIKLLEKAVENTSLSHFVFLSGNCVPLFDYTHTCDVISQLHYSSFHVFKYSNIRNVPTEYHHCSLRHSQWCILTRKDVDLIINNVHTHKFEKVSIPDETYFGTVLKYFNVNFDNNVTTCVNWKKVNKHCKGRSPYLYETVSQELIHNINKLFPRALFLRKVSHNIKDIPYVRKYLDIYKFSNQTNLHHIKFSNQTNLHHIKFVNKTN